MMPRPRFEKLSDEKKAAILDAAAAEFSVNGFRAASFNQIIENAGLSKGAMYYYFDDKEDLFLTVVKKLQDAIMEQLGELGPCDDPDSYWAEIRVLFARGARIKQEDPTIIHMGMALVKSAAAGDTHLSFDRLFDNVHGWLEAVVVKGQAVGAVRMDLPASLLVAQLWAVSGAMDVWAVQHLTDEMIHRIDFEKATDFTIDLYRRLMEPGEEIGFFWPVNDDGQEG
jgi:AcrR family transcriptional regulator